jgi:hypothetical protein
MVRSMNLFLHGKYYKLGLQSLSILLTVHLCPANCKTYNFLPIVSCLSHKLSEHLSCFGSTFINNSNIPGDRNKKLYYNFLDFCTYYTRKNIQFSPTTQYLTLSITLENEGGFYVGNFDELKMQGIGLLIWQNTTYYLGMFRNGNFHGLGKLVINESSYYFGNWEYGKRNGHGLSLDPSGTVYIGDYVSDKKNGYGTLVDVRMGRYIGDFMDDEFNGNGTLILNDGTEYHGRWINGLKDGRFTVYNSDGLFKSEEVWSGGLRIYMLNHWDP